MKFIVQIVKSISLTSLCWIVLLGCGQAMDVYLDRTYYTTERFASLICSLPLSSQALKGKRLILMDRQEKILVEIENPGTENRIPIELKAIKNGEQILTAALKTTDGRSLFEKALLLRKLPPKPGCEWKVDRVDGVILRNGKPFFPFGAWAWATESTFKELSEIGFNCVRPMGLHHILRTPDKLPEVMTAAEKNDLCVILSPTSFSRPPVKLETVTNFVEDKELLKRINEVNTSGDVNMMLTMKFLLRDPSLNRQERNAIYDELFERFAPVMKRSVQLTRDYTNLMGYGNIDEPHDIRYFDIFVAVRKIYDMFMRTDGYHPGFVLYPSQVKGPVEGLCDVLGADVYWTPGRPAGNDKSTVDYVARSTALISRRAKKEHLGTWITPAASWWSDTHKRPYTGAEIICQTYLSLIHGAKAITFYHYANASHQSQYNAFVRLAKDVEILAPILTAPRLPQTVYYSPREFIPDKRPYPDVHTCLMRDPKGGFVLLAVNSRNYAVDAMFRIAGMSGSVKDLFSEKVVLTEDSSFSERFEPLARSVYSIENIAISEAAVRLDVEAKAHNAGYKAETGFQKEGRKGKRNILPNPSFEEESLKNWPDYYRVGAPLIKIGNPDCPWGLVTDDPYHGEKCLRSKGGKWFFYISPRASEAEAYMFSVYMKTDKPETTVGFRYCEEEQYVNVSDNSWKQYSFPVTVPVNPGGGNMRFMVRILDREATVWFDAIQFERGTVPSEFED